MPDLPQKPCDDRRRRAEVGGREPGDDVRARTIAPGRLKLGSVDALIEEFAGALDGSVYPPGYLEDVRKGWREPSSTPT